MKKGSGVWKSTPAPVHLRPPLCDYTYSHGENKGPQKCLPPKHAIIYPLDDHFLNHKLSSDPEVQPSSSQHCKAARGIKINASLLLIILSIRLHKCFTSLSFPDLPSNTKNVLQLKLLFNIAKVAVLPGDISHCSASLAAPT